MWRKCCIQRNDRLESGRNDRCEAKTVGNVTVSGDYYRLYMGISER